MCRTTVDATNNGRSRTAVKGDRTYSGQMKALTAKLINLKYYVPIAYLQQVTSIPRYVKFGYKNELDKGLSTIVRTIYSVVRADYGVCRDTLSFGTNNTTFCPYNSRVNFFDG